MPVTHAFTWLSMLAVGLLLLVLWIVLRRRARYVKSGRNGPGRLAAFFLVRVVSVRLFSSVVLMVAGMGILAGQRWTAWGIALLPLIYVVATLWDLRDLS